MADLYGGMSPFSPVIASYDPTPLDNASKGVMDFLQEYKKKQDFEDAMKDPTLRAYIQRQLQPPQVLGDPNFNSPLDPGAGRAVQNLSPYVGIQQPVQYPSPTGGQMQPPAPTVRQAANRTNRAGADAIVQQELERRFGPQQPSTPLDIGTPQILSRNGVPTAPASKMESTVTGKWTPPPSSPGRPMMSGPATSPRPDTPLFSSPEAFAMFQQMLPQGTQRDMTTMQTQASMFNAKANQEGQNQRNVLGAAVKMLGQVNSRMGNLDSIIGRYRAAQLKAGASKQADLLKLAKEAGDRAGELQKVVSDQTIAALDTLPPDSQGYQQYQLMKQQAAQAKALSEMLFQQAQVQYGAGAGGKRGAGTPVNTNPAAARKPVDQMNLDDVNAELARMGAAG